MPTQQPAAAPALSLLPSVSYASAAPPRPAPAGPVRCGTRLVRDPTRPLLRGRWQPQQAPPLLVKMQQQAQPPVQQGPLQPPLQPLPPLSTSFSPPPVTITTTTSKLAAAGASAPLIGAAEADGSRHEALIVADPKAPSPQNSFAGGKGIQVPAFVHSCTRARPASLWAGARQ